MSKSSGVGRAETAADQIDRQLAAVGLRKQREGQVPTARERDALRRWERRQEEELRWRYYGSIPKGHYAQLSGRQPKVLNDQARRYGIPLLARTIDLGAVLTWLHDFLAEQPDSKGRSRNRESAELRRYRRERALLARLDRLERERSVLPRAEVHELLARIAGILHQAGSTLDRQYGPEALEILADALEEAEHEIDRYFGQAAESGRPGPRGAGLDAPGGQGPADPLNPPIRRGGARHP